VFCVSEGCNNLPMLSSDAAQPRLYSPNNHISPGKSGSCYSKRPTSSASVTTPPCSVLKNVMVSHHMDRSSSTPRLTLKFHHVKRHENGIAAAADVSRLHSVADSVSQLPPAVSASSNTTSISCVDSHYLTASSPSTRYCGAGVDSEGHQVLKNSFEKNRNNSSADNQQHLMPFSPQFEDISDAEDDIRPATMNPQNSVCTAPASYSLPPPASQRLPPLPSGLYPSAASSTFCTPAVTLSASYSPFVGWNSYSGTGFVSQNATTLPASAANVGQSSGRIPWAGENQTQMGVINHLSPVMSTRGPVLATDAPQWNLSSRQQFLNNRFVGGDGVGCLKSEVPRVKSEVLETDEFLSQQISFKLENCNGHVGDVKSESFIEAELLNSRSATSREPSPSRLVSKLGCFASRFKSEETVLSNNDSFVRSQHIHEDVKDSVKTGSHDSEVNFLNSVQVKPDIDDTLPSRFRQCHHSPAASMSPSLQTSCLEPVVTVNSYTPSAQVLADDTQVPSNLEPKVPPLRIIIPSKVCSTGSLSDGSNTNTTSRCGVSSLPYVVNRTHSADSDVAAITTDEVRRSDSSPAVFTSSDSDHLSTAKEASANSDLIPAKRRKIKHSSKVSVYVCIELNVIIICCVGYDFHVSCIAVLFLN